MNNFPLAERLYHSLSSLRNDLLRHSVGRSPSSLRLQPVPTAPNIQTLAITHITLLSRLLLHTTSSIFALESDLFPNELSPTSRLDNLLSMARQDFASDGSGPTEEAGEWLETQLARAVEKVRDGMARSIEYRRLWGMLKLLARFVGGASQAGELNGIPRGSLEALVGWFWEEMRGVTGAGEGERLDGLVSLVWYEGWQETDGVTGVVEMWEGI